MFQVTFQLFTPPGTTGLQAELLLPFTPVDTGISKFDLSVELIWTEQSFRGHIEYCTDLFDAGRIDRMVGHFLRLLEGVTADPTRRVCDYPILTPAEEHRLVVEWNRTASPYPRDRTIPEVFRRAGRTGAGRAGGPVRRADGDLPGAAKRRRRQSRLSWRRGGCDPAIWSGSTWTAARTPGRPAGHPRCRRGVRATRHGLPRRADRIPTDRQWGPGRTDDDRPGRPTWPASTGAVIAIDRPVDSRSASPTPGTSPTDIAYVMYTSGTTGRPKGVAVTHRNVLRLVKDVSYVEFGPARAWSCSSLRCRSTHRRSRCGAACSTGARWSSTRPGCPSLDELGAFIRCRAAHPGLPDHRPVRDR